MKIYIIHGWSYNLDKWSNFSSLLKQNGLEPVMLKVPGLTKPGNKVWDINGYVKWLDGELRNEAHPVVIAQSNGGRIALAYALANPGKIKQLFLIDSAGMADKRLLRKIKLKVLFILSKLGKPLSKINLVRKVFYKIIGAQDYDRASPAMRKTMQNMLNADKNLDLKAIQMPVTLIWGRDDTITPLKDGQKMNGRIKGSNLFVIDDAKHAPQATHSDEVVDIIKRELK
ncbi:MAG TPA: alpha/beta hydrolase [Candidatus Saccharimonadales bacterium]|nr:alpha/beta hydrolase [Candidatus Saccharimonadales bacterium]